VFKMSSNKNMRWFYLKGLLFRQKLQQINVNIRLSSAGGSGSSEDTWFLLRSSFTVCCLEMDPGTQTHEATEAERSRDGSGSRVFLTEPQLRSQK
ncbi:hypothetical protein XENOCAPTIV_008432, partial [Xenoophorus captivus]